MSNLRHWDALSTPPDTALRAIKAGRLSGKTDINPVWRFRALTELFGPVGEGWMYEIKRTWSEPGAGGEVFAFAEVWLYYREPGGAPDAPFSPPIPGIGGTMLVAKESSGLHSDDDAYAKSVTDAIGKACKALGVAARVYWDQMDGSKYQRETPDPQSAARPSAASNAARRPAQPPPAKPLLDDKVGDWDPSESGTKKIVVTFKSGKKMTIRVHQDWNNDQHIKHEVAAFALIKAKSRAKDIGLTDEHANRALAEAVASAGYEHYSLIPWRGIGGKDGPKPIDQVIASAIENLDLMRQQTNAEAEGSGAHLDGDEGY